MIFFDKIVFNFPHTACGIKDTAENNRVHQRLLTAFFNAAIPLQKPATITKNWVGKKQKPQLSQIHVTLKTGDRLRQCITDPEAPNVLFSTLSEDAKLIVKKLRDRDSLGSAGICQKGIYKLLRKQIPYYEPSFYYKPVSSAA